MRSSVLILCASLFFANGVAQAGDVPLSTIIRRNLKEILVDDYGLSCSDNSGIHCEESDTGRRIWLFVNTQETKRRTSFEVNIHQNLFSVYNSSNSAADVRLNLNRRLATSLGKVRESVIGRKLLLELLNRLNNELLEGRATVSENTAGRFSTRRDGVFLDKGHRVGFWETSGLDANQVIFKGEEIEFVDSSIYVQFK
ncbi:MAG: hypothetical protein JNL01_03820 [Bdellovibrionales bacterium]|nr:hypothetical protein [Bdellovibrionales bacterium]